MAKIMIISNTSWNLFNFRLPLMSRLREEGFDLIAVAPFDEYSERIETSGFRHVCLPMNNKGTNPVQDMWLIFRLYKLFTLEKPDIILTYTAKPNIYASIVAGLMSIPVIPNISGLGNVFIRKSIVTDIVKQLYKFALRFPPLVLFQNHDDLQLFINMGLVSRERARRIPGSGVNTSLYAPESTKKGNSFIFLLVARMLWDKGIGEFIEAARQLKDPSGHTRFQLLGFLDVVNPQAISREQMKQWIDEGIVEYLGATDDVKSHMLVSDCVVLPSYREGLPRTLLEGASLAKPLIASDVPGCRDVIEDGETGYLCRKRDANDMAACMKKMILLSAEERAEMGMRGREKIIREFDEKIVIDIYLEAINSAII